MAKTKVAVLGGGIAGLTAAYQLSRTPQLQASYEVTLYQLGWRLGGKLASGRDASGRNLEHGLHVWFGCYDNAFRMLQEIFDAPQQPPDDRSGGWCSAVAVLRAMFKRTRRPQNAASLSWRDVIKPQNYTPVGVVADGKSQYWPVTWPSNADTPGDGRLDVTPWGAFTEILSLLRQAIERFPPLADSPTAAAAREPWVEQRFAEAMAGVAATGLTAERRGTIAGLAHAAHAWAQAVAAAPTRDNGDHGRGIVRLVEALRDEVDRSCDRPQLNPLDHRMLHELTVLASAFIRGLWSDVFVAGQTLSLLDGMDFRDWLVKHGADPQIVANGTFVRILYDTMFQYIDGDVAKASYAAGTAARVLLRLLTTYKEAMLWLIQSGMGEAVIAPLYQRLLAQGVRFKFFRRVDRLELSSDKRLVQRIHLARQADIVSGVDYQPTKVVAGLTCWPSEPLWNQIVDGEKMRAAGINFESHWCQWPSAGDEVLERGSDFDVAVLAIAMGAFKPLNPEPGLADELIAANDRFRTMVSTLELAPSQSLQLWCDKTVDQLGWSTGKAATVAGPEYLNIWADMSQVLDHEPWTGLTKPKSLHYMCGTYSTRLYRQPSTDQNVPKQASAEIRHSAVNWLTTSAYGLWPSAAQPGSFDWSVLTDPNRRSGTDRLNAQFWRANVDPTECCVLSSAGTTQNRLATDESGFENLFLAGEAIRTNLNQTCVEDAVMSGMAASRAICGSPATIVGENFFP